MFIFDVVATSAGDSEWTALSIATLVLATVGTATGALALILAWKNHPRPHFTSEWASVPKPTASEATSRTVILRVINDGTAPARRVRLSVDIAEDMNREPWFEAVSFSEGTDVRLHVPVVGSWRVVNLDGEVTYHPYPGVDYWDTQRPKVTLRHSGRRRAYSSRSPQYM